MGAAHKRYYYSDAGVYNETFRRGKRTDSKEFYTHGTAAHKLDPIREAAPAPYYGPLRRVKKKREPLSIYKAVCLLIVCLSFISIVYVRSQVYHSQLENTRLESALDDARDKTETIIAQNTEKADVAYIEEIARTKLNMSKPQSYQIVYIDVPKTDYTIVHEAPIIVEKERFGLASMKGVMDKMRGRTTETEAEAENDTEAQTKATEAGEQKPE